MVPRRQKLAFASNRDGNFEIYLMGTSGENPQRATTNSGIDNFPTYSPRGELTFVSQNSGGFDIYLLRDESQTAAAK